MSTNPFVILWCALAAGISAYAYYQAIQGLKRGWIRRSSLGGKIRRDERYGLFQIGIAFLFIVGTIGIAMLIYVVMQTRG